MNLRTNKHNRIIHWVGIFLLFSMLTSQRSLIPPQVGYAKPLAQANANVSLAITSPVWIGEDFSFTVTFENNGLVPGYGPFVDLVFPLTGGDGDGDGINYISASYLSSPLIDDVQIFPGIPGPGNTGCVSHPWLRDINGAYVDVCGPSGDQFVSLMLPFGSYVPGQPAIDITVNAHLDNFANLTPDLLIYARGGYMFGETPEDDWCCGDVPFAIPSDTNSLAWPDTPVTPQIFTFSKGYLGPDNTEDETATGPNFIQQYALTLNIASGQTLNNIVFRDVLPDNAQYVGINATELADPDDPTSTTTGGFVVNSSPNPGEPDGTLEVFYASGTGRVIVVFDFYIPELFDSTGGTTYDDPVIDPDTGDDVTSGNIAWVEADWTPMDPDDPVETLNSDSSCPTCPPLHTLTDKSIAIQKSVAVVANGGGPGNDEPIPGAILEYTIEFQVSDYFTFDNLVVTDTISDGQHVLPEAAFAPTMQINGNPNSFGPVAINDGNYTVSCDYTGATTTPPTECEAVTGGATGETTLIFNVSDEIDDHQPDGTMLGGCVNPAGGLYFPCDPLNLNDGPTEGTIIFQTEILDQFVDDYPSGDISVDQGDVFGNTVIIDGDIFDNVSGLQEGDEDDNATAGAEIGREELSKSIYAINDDSNDANWDKDALGRIRIKPGDKITYRLTYDLLTSDVEELTFDDYFPLPVFHVDDPDENGGPSHVWTFTESVPYPHGCPDPGAVTLYLPFDPVNGDTFYQYMTSGISGGTGILSPSTFNTVPTQEPVLDTDPAANRLMIYYADYDDTRNQATTVDLLFSLIVSDDPFADGLFLTNMAHAFEGSTNAGTNTEDAIIQFVLNEPVLVSQKGIVWTSNTSATFTPTDVGPAGVTFLDPTHASVPPRWDGIINSNGLAANPINSDLSGVDAEDKLTFAITIENTGNSLKGAFDIQLKDILNTTYYLTPYTAVPGIDTDLNLQIYYGSDGDRPPPPLDGPIPYRAVDGSCSASGDNDVCGMELFNEGIELVDPAETPPGTMGVCSANDPTLGNNVIIITYDLVIKPDVIPGDAVNTVTLFHYAGEEDGPNHLHEDGPQEDDATASIVGVLEKTLDNTEIDNFATTGTNLQTEVVIGELVTYTLTATVPEGQVPNARLVDHLDGGLAFVSCDAITVTADTGMTTDLALADFSGVCTETETSPSGVTNDGQDILFNLGNITNDDRDDNPETIAITYTVVTLNTNNVNGNQAGVLLNNQVQFLMNELGEPEPYVTLDTASADEVTVIEPRINTEKLPLLSSGDAGNPFTYSITLTNLAGADETDAFDAEFLDDFPMCPNPADGSAVHDLVLGAQSGPATFVLSEPGGVGTGNTAGWRLTATGFDMAPGEVATVDVSGTIAYCVPPGLALTNTGTTTWTSLSGIVVDRSTYNPDDSDERTGADGVDGALNDYASQGQSVIDIIDTVSEKYLAETTTGAIKTSEAHTGDPGDGVQRVAIGEIVRYRLKVLIPEGTSSNFQVQDYLPPGMTFKDDGTAVVIFLSNDPAGGITSSPFGSIPGITDSDCFLTPYNSADASTPEIPGPPNACAHLADFNVGSSSSTSLDPDSYPTDGDVFIKLGTLRNNDSDGDNEYVVIEFTAQIDNNITVPNDAGDILENYFQAFINGVSNGGPSNRVEVIVAEPDLTITKTITNLPASEDGNDDIEYTLVITNNSDPLLNDATAYDIVLTDTFDNYITGISLDSVTPGPGGTCVGNGSGNIPFNHSGLGSLSGHNLNFWATCLDPGDSITLVISGTLDPLIPAGYYLQNLAELLWTSLPGGGTSPNVTESITLGGSGAPDGERDGSGGVNDYRDTDNANITLAAPEVDKDVNPTDYPIGAEFTYDILVTLPEGNTPDMVFYDDLPVGLEYRSHSINTAAFNGTFTNDPTNPANVTTPPPPPPSGGVFSIDFGDTNTVANNNGADDSFLIQITVRVVNEIDNQNEDILTNQGEIRYSSGTTGTGSVSIRIIEPVLLVDKVTIPSPASDLDAGDTFQYQVTISHDQDTVPEDSLSHAYDVLLTDLLDGGSPDIRIISIDSTTLNGGATVDSPTTITGGGTGLTGQYDIPLGGSVVITYTAELQDSIRPNQTLTNDVDIAWSSLNGNPAQARDGSGAPLNDYLNNTDIDVVTSSQLEIDKSVIDSSAPHTPGNWLTIGEEVTYELIVTVIEGITDTVVVTDTLPDNINFIPGTLTVTPNGPGMTTGYAGPPSWADPVLTVNLGQIVNPSDGNSANDTIAIEFEALVENDLTNQDGMTKTNDAEVTDGNLTDTSSADVLIVEPELSITKSVDDDTPALGQTITYTVRLLNISDINAYDVALEDIMPTGVVFVSLISANGFGVGCPVNVLTGFSSTPNQYNAAFDVIQNGCGVDIVYDARVDDPFSPDVPALGITIYNTAEVTWASLLAGANRRYGDGILGGLNDYERDTTQGITPTNPDLMVIKDDGVDVYIPGSFVTYTITVTNVGNAAVTGAVVSDTIPPEVVSWNWVCVGPPPAGIDCDGGSTTPTFTDLVNLGPSESFSYQVTANIDPSVTSDMTNTVTVEMPFGVFEPTLGNNTDSDTDTSQPHADLTVSKDDFVTIISPGTTTTYTIVVQNTSPSDVLGAIVTDLKPPEIDSWDWACTGATGGATGCTPAPSSTADFTDIVDLPTGSSITYTVTAQVSATASGSFTNTVTVDVPSGVIEDNPLDNTASDTDSFPENTKDLVGQLHGVTILPDVAIGEVLTYEVVLTVPVGSMTNLHLVDTLDRGLAFVRCEVITAGQNLFTSVGSFSSVCSNPTVSTYPSGSPNDEDRGRQVDFNFGTLTNGGAGDEDLIVRYEVVILDSLGNQSGTTPPLNNLAEWSWDSGHETNQAVGVVILEPDLRLSKDADRNVAYKGQTVTFTLTVHHSPASQTPAYDLVLEDVVPGGLNYVTGSLRHVSGQAPDSLNDLGAPTLVITWSVFDNSGVNSVIAFDVVIDGSMRHGRPVTNNATLSWTSLAEDYTSPQSTHNDLSTERFYDPLSNVNVYGVRDSEEIRLPALPGTGFAPGRVTQLPLQPEDQQYANLNELQVEIPKLGLSLPIVSIPQSEDGWDLTWLWNQAGWLEGTAYPSWIGNTVLTGHAYLASGAPGPFVNLSSLSWGDEIILNAHGLKYTYQVRVKELVSGDDLSILEHKDQDWLTLFTCQEFSEFRNEYLWRQVVQAVLIDVDQLD